MKKLLLSFLLVLAFTVICYSQINKTITISIAGGISADVVNAYAWEFDYQVQISDGEGGFIPNPESKGQFALRMFVEQAQNSIRSTYKGYKTYQGSVAAAAQADIDSLGITVQ